MRTDPNAQLVYTVIKPDPRPRPCGAPVAALGGLLALTPSPRWPRIMFGEVAHPDESEDEVEDGCVAVRVRGRVISTPLYALRPVD